MSHPQYLVYSKPECPHCVRAKGYLAEKSIPFTEQSLEADARKALIDKLGGRHTTFPVIFKLNAAGVPVQFVGGADGLQKALFGG